MPVTIVDNVVLRATLTMNRLSGKDEFRYGRGDMFMNTEGPAYSKTGAVCGCKNVRTLSDGRKMLVCRNRSFLFQKLRVSIVVGHLISKGNRRLTTRISLETCDIKCFRVIVVTVHCILSCHRTSLYPSNLQRGSLEFRSTPQRADSRKVSWSEFFLGDVPEPYDDTLWRDAGEKLISRKQTHLLM
jgi:hypothetical protein